MANKKTVKKDENKKSSKKLWIIISVVVVAVLVALFSYPYISTAVKYTGAIEEIENGNFKDGFDTLIELAKQGDDYEEDSRYNYENNYKDTNELLYTRAIELIETGGKENKQAAYKMLEQTYDYKHTNEIVYFLWAEDVYDPEDEASFEQANQFMLSIPEAYDGPFKEEVAQLRSQVNKSYSELMQKKYEAATSTDDFSQEVIAE